MSATTTLRRLQKELAEMKNHSSSVINVNKVNENNLLHWELKLTPEHEPYNKGAFRINVDFPTDYPFKPPSITFVTKIYHPNIDENGKICLGIITSENWRPATRIEQVMTALVQLIAQPDIDHSLRAELAEEYRKEHDKFVKNAEEFTIKHAEKRN